MTEYDESRRIYLSLSYKSKKTYVSLPAIFGDEHKEMHIYRANAPYLWYLDIQIPTESNCKLTSIKFVCLTGDDDAKISINAQRLFHIDKERGYYHIEKQMINEIKQCSFLVLNQLMNDIKDWKTFNYSMDILTSLRYIDEIKKLWKSAPEALSWKYYKIIYVAIQFLKRFTKKIHLINYEISPFLDFIKKWDFKQRSQIESRPELKRWIKSYSSEFIFLFDMKESEIFYNVWCMERDRIKIKQKHILWNFTNYGSLYYAAKNKWDDLIDRTSKSRLNFDDGIYFKDINPQNNESVDYMLLDKYLKMNVVESFHCGIHEIAGFCETLNHLTIINVPYNVLNAYKTVLALGLELDTVSWNQLEDVKETIFEIIYNKLVVDIPYNVFKAYKTVLALGLELDTYSWNGLDDVKYNILKEKRRNTMFASIDEALWFYNYALKHAKLGGVEQDDDILEVD